MVLDDSKKENKPYSNNEDEVYKSVDNWVSKVLFIFDIIEI